MFYRIAQICRVRKVRRRVKDESREHGGTCAATGMEFWDCGAIRTRYMEGQGDLVSR